MPLLTRYIRYGVFAFNFRFSEGGRLPNRRLG